jgi:hypothetical protein
VSATGSLIRRYRWLPWFGVGLVLAVGFVLWFFKPQALLLDNTVSEARPELAQRPAVTGKDGARSASSRGVLSDGSFRPLGHQARGTALVIDAAQGNTYLRFEDFEVENGPDLRVYLSRAQAGAPEGELAADIVDLGGLKGNVGDQNYLLPDSVDLGEYRSVVVWCRRFSVGFAVAPINVRSS